jgi:LmbE family N-acetylglucosaminyl deacetylase
MLHHEGARMNEERTFLTIMAHPDDSAYLCGGTEARLSDEEGWRGIDLIVTDGAGGIPDNTPAYEIEAKRREIAATRRQEQRAASRVLGVKEVVFWDYPDGQLADHFQELLDDLVRFVREVKPQRIICSQFYREEKRDTPAIYTLNQPPAGDQVWPYHSDHLAVGQAVMSLYPAAQNPQAYKGLLEEGLNPHRTSEIWIAGSKHPNLIVPLTVEHIRKKQESLLTHRSQHMERMVASLWEEARATGHAFGVDYAEAFHVWRNDY